MGRRLSALVYPDDLEVLEEAGTRARKPRPRAKCAWCAPGAACAGASWRRRCSAMPAAGPRTSWSTWWTSVGTSVLRPPCATWPPGTPCPAWPTAAGSSSNWRSIRGPAPRTGPGGRCSSWTWTISRRSTTPSVTRRVTGSSSRWPSPCAGTCADRDLVARLGGDEFAVVLRDGDARAAEAVARKLVLAVRDEVTTGQADGGVTMSVGVAALRAAAHDGRA